MRMLVLAVSTAASPFLLPVLEAQAHPLCEKIRNAEYRAACKCHGDNGGSVEMRENGKIVWFKPGGRGSRSGYSPEIDKCLYKLQNR